jgi:DNA gyrase subunit A
MARTPGTRRPRRDDTTPDATEVPQLDLFGGEGAAAEGAPFEPQDNPSTAAGSALMSGAVPPLPPSGFGGAAAGGGGGGHGDGIREIPLHDETQRRYLNYALSVVTARALPDVRDGLKPVQRRILYAMFLEHLYPDGRYRKSAKVVGDVIGKYHPHGDVAVYDAMVRMAQDFSLRYPVVDGQGNFGSLDGDGAAAYRYTECKLAPFAMELLEELRKGTVHFKPTFDGQASEPVVLPARAPQLLVNGSSGIAVGMATNIPPHNLGEVVLACEAMIDARLGGEELKTKDLLKFVKGPDFPTGGQMLSTRAELREVYETGQGAVKVRGEYDVEEGKRGQQSIVVTSIPYAVSKAKIVEEIAEVILSRRLGLLTDVRDESTSDVRIVLEMKKGADPQMIMAYLFKHTSLQQNFNVNLTALVPTDNPEIGAPRRLDLAACLGHFLDFRLEVVRKRFEHDLAELKKRLHILEGFKRIYDALDEVIRIIRKSEGKADAAGKLMKRFELDDEQVDAILELKLYRLARLEILLVEEELEKKAKEAKRIENLLKSQARLWGVVKDELSELRTQFGDKRRTRVGGAGEEPEFDAEAYIVEEDAHVLLSRDGWIKRQRELKDAGATRLREGDELLGVARGSTRAQVALFSSFGSCYVARVNDIPASTGYGEPVQKLYKFEDRERGLSLASFDARLLGGRTTGLAVTRRGMALRFPLEPHLEPSTRAGRKFAKLAEGDEIAAVLLCPLEPDPDKSEYVVCAATRNGRGILCELASINLLAGPGRGVQLLKLDEDDDLLGAAIVRRKAAPDEGLTVETERGKQVLIGPRAFSVTSRGGRGLPVTRREKVDHVVQPPFDLTPLTPTGGPDGESSGMLN